MFAARWKIQQIRGVLNSASRQVTALEVLNSRLAEELSVIEIGALESISNKLVGQVGEQIDQILEISIEQAAVYAEEEQERREEIYAAKVAAWENGFRRF